MPRNDYIPVGAGLPAMAANLIHRVALIASKPAPTGCA
ncbi:acyl CoA:acetate/3-ketoacid CoA transferase beta subunit [Pseudomonas laurylsulfatiphila]